MSKSFISTYPHLWFSWFGTLAQHCLSWMWTTRDRGLKEVYNSGFLATCRNARTCVSEGKPDAPCIAVSGNWSVRVAGYVDVGDAASLRRKQIFARRHQLHKSAALVKLEPAPLDREPNAGAEFRSGPLAAALREERVIDLFDMDAAVDRLDANGELDQLTGSSLWLRVMTLTS